MKKYFILAAAAMGMVACNNDDSSYSPALGDGLIHLTVSVKSSEGTTRASAAGELQNAAFVAGKTIYVEAYETGEAMAYASGTYTTGDAGALTGSLRYPANNHNIDLCAYYPGDITSSSTAFAVQTDQSADAGYQASDLMYATKLTNKGSNATHNLVFNHALTKVVVNIVAGEGVTSENITGTPGVTAVKLNNTKPDAQLAIANGEITASQASSGSAADINITGTGASNTGIIVPQQVAAGAFITVTYNSIDYTYSLPEAKTFEGGKVYTYTLTLGTKALTLTATSINEWMAETGGEGEFGMESYALLNSATYSDIGLVVCSNGHIHANTSAVNCGGTASAMIAYISSTGHGLAVALNDFCDANGTPGTGAIYWDQAKAGAPVYQGSKPEGVSWKLPSEEDFNNMMGSNGCLSDTNLFEMKGRQSSACGGTANLSVGGYWTTTPFAGYGCNYSYVYHSWVYGDGPGVEKARACFEF